MESPPEAKVCLFRALFRGREDVYARRYMSAKTGKSGYAPACAVEWVDGLCDKKRVACAVCPNRRFLPLDDETIRMHLVGRDARSRDFTIGCYPLLPDDTVKLPDVIVIRFALPPLRTRMKPEASSASRSSAPDET